MSDPKAATSDKSKMMTKLSASAGEFVPTVSYRSVPDEYLKGVGRAGTTRTMCSWPDDKTVEIVGGPVAPIVSSSMHPCNKLAPGDHCAWALDNSMLMGPWQAVLWIWLQLVRPRYVCLANRSVIIPHTHRRNRKGDSSVEWTTFAIVPWFSVYDRFTQMCLLLRPFLWS